MIRSLRLRFFLITWPLVVLAVAGVSLAFDRWTGVELESLERVLDGGEAGDAAGIAERVARAWSEAGFAAPPEESLLRIAAEQDSIDLVLQRADGSLVYTTDPEIRLRAAAAEPGVEPAFFIRSLRDGPRVAEQDLAVTGVPVSDVSGVIRGYLYVLPTGDEILTGDRRAALRAGARRTLWASFLIASVVAAALALVLAGPLVGQIARLADAATRLQSGALSARVSLGREDELGKLERAFNAMAAALQRAEAHKQNLVSDVAHELRTPLSNVLGILEAVEDGLREPDDATLALLGSEARLLAELVDELHELSMAESGQMEFDLIDVDVVAEVEAALDAVRDGSGGVVLEGPAAGASALARADARRLRQVLRNLLRNALVHTAAGGSVRVEIAHSPREVGIRVIDSGCGIPPEHLALVWERFHRVDPARDRSTGGRGLGLAIVKHLVEGMGGRVHVESTEGVGSTFVVWFREGGRPGARSGGAT